jgi:hypothetical protein
VAENARNATADAGAAETTLTSAASTSTTGVNPPRGNQDLLILESIALPWP